VFSLAKKPKKMAGKTKTMEQIRNILQQRINGASIRSITMATGASRNTIRAYLRTIEGKGLTLRDAIKLDDRGLAQILFEPDRPPAFTDHYSDLENKLAYYAKELRKPHVTRWLLWEEYRQEFSDGYGYTRFCHHLNNYINHKEVTAIFHHIPAQKLMVDFAGDTLSYVDKTTGEVVKCQVLITCLPFSSYIYAEALPSQKQHDFIKGLTNALLYLGGVPQCIVCDNLKSAVKKADRYEPSFTQLIEQLSLHYQLTFMATRAGKPRDKAAVESSVNVAYTRIYAKLRNTLCHDIRELNGQIRDALESLNQRNFKGRNYSREDVFLQYEQSHLNPLPAKTFEVKKRVTAKVQRNYHIILGEDMHQYSVPWQMAGKQVNAIYTADIVEIYHNHERIAVHQRNYRRHGYTTCREHMPENHRAIMDQKGWDADYFLQQAGKAGESVRQVIAQVLESKAFPEQTYNSCLGILRLGNKYGNQRLETACKLILQGPRVNYGILSNILKNNMDKRLDSDANQDFRTPPHDNVRGSGNY
jgi:transposase